MADVELLPLPKASKMYDILGYDEEELKDYARANVAVATATLQAEIQGLREQLRLATVDQVNAEAEANDARAERLEAEVERLRADRDSWEQQASDRVADWHAEHLRAERLAEALRESHGEVLRLRAAMFRVYATAANGGNPTMYIEQMRDEMDKPWSGEKASAALEQESGRG